MFSVILKNIFVFYILRVFLKKFKNILYFYLF
jgi:hypothetical protein